MTGEEAPQEQSEKYAFEEFKMYFESADRVTDRRLSFNQTSQSLSTAIVLAIIVGWNWALANLHYAYLVFALTGILSALAILFCALWLRQVRDFKRLNTAKFQVLNDMAPHLTFDVQSPTYDPVSYKPFEREWKLMEEMGGLQGKRPSGQRQSLVRGLRSTTFELFLPQAFTMVFVALLVVSTGYVALHWDVYLREWHRLTGV